MNKSWILAGFLTLGSFGTLIGQETKQEEREALDEIVIDSRFKIKKENLNEHANGATDNHH